MSDSQKTESVYRVDKFVVPAGVREEFLAKVRRTHDQLRTLPGMVDDVLLEQSGGPGEFNIVTMVEWAGEEFIEGAIAAVTALHREIGFNPQEFARENGIRADIALYRRIAS